MIPEPVAGGTAELPEHAPVVSGIRLHAGRCGEPRDDVGKAVAVQVPRAGKTRRRHWPRQQRGLRLTADQEQHKAQQDRDEPLHRDVIIIRRDRTGRAAPRESSRSPPPRGQKIPSLSFAASDIMFRSQTGSKTRSALTSFTPGIEASFVSISFWSTPPIPQPGAVSVNLTAAFQPPSGSARSVTSL